MVEFSLFFKREESSHYTSQWPTVSLLQTVLSQYGKEVGNTNSVTQAMVLTGQLCNFTCTHAV